MGFLKRQLIDEQLEDTGEVFDDDRGINERGFYPGEEEAMENEARRKWELSKYTSEELTDELSHRVMEPINKSLTELQNALEALTGKDSRPF